MNAAGLVIITWAEREDAILADSGMVLGGFAAPVTVAATYGHGRNPQVAVNNAGQAPLT